MSRWKRNVYLFGKVKLPLEILIETTSDNNPPTYPRDKTLEDVAYWLRPFCTVVFVPVWEQPLPDPPEDV